MELSEGAMRLLYDFTNDLDPSRSDGKYYVDLEKFIHGLSDGTEPKGSRASPVSDELISSFFEELKQMLDRILNELEKLVRRVKLEELDLFMGISDADRISASAATRFRNIVVDSAERDTASGAIRRWKDEAIYKFNDRTGIGTDYWLERYGWEEQDEDHKKACDAPPNIWSNDERVERAAKVLSDLTHSELLNVFLEAQHRENILALSLRAGEVFAGNRAARRLFTAAKNSIDIIDTWLGPEVFDMLEVTSATVHRRLLTDKINSATRNAFLAFKKQYGKIELRIVPPLIHDRYIILDQIVAIHLGHSIKDLGTKKAEIHPMDVTAQIRDFEEFWKKLSPMT